MRVVLAEKPSVARDLARVLGARQRRDGWLEGNGWQVTWAIGHLVQLKTPDEYDPALKRWSMERLPFVPERFELRPTAGDTRRQLDVVAELCRSAEELVCATDAGREGELICRYILEWAGCASRPYTRLWLSSLTDAAIEQAFASRKSAVEYERLHDAARSRSEADWLVGLNATRAYTVRYGGGAVLWSVGRVQTPVLALIAQRDDEIRCFDTRPFWELRTRYRGARFRCAGERFQSEAAAQAVLAQVQDQPFTITRIERRTEAMPPPWLYDLTQLQRDLNLRHGLSAQRTLTLAQELYEQQLLTYPRTDSRHLPLSMVDTARTTLAQLRAWDPAKLAVLAAWIAGAPDGSRGPKARSPRVFDDTKVRDHHAIVPTGKVADLTGEAQWVYDAVATRFVQAFLGDRVQDVTTAHAQSHEVPFRARGVVVTDPGWHALEPAAPKPRGKRKSPASGPSDSGEAGDDDVQELPSLQEGETGPHHPELHAGQTKPPRPYTENTLLAAMETAGKTIDDEQLRQAMRQRGLGTPATRAAILETLIERRYVRREQKALRTTDLGRYLVAIIADPLLKSPELTGEWEFRLGEIERGALDRTTFMQDIVAQVRRLLASGLSPHNDQPGLGQCPRCRAEVVAGRTAYGCARWREDCAFRLPKVYRGVTLAREQVRELLFRGLCLRPLTLEGQPRILCRTADGALFDLEPPSRAAQRAAPAAAARPRRRRRGTAGAE
jgi:DNA topoisomerase-3